MSDAVSQTLIFMMVASDLSEHLKQRGTGTVLFPVVIVLCSTLEIYKWVAVSATRFRTGVVWEFPHWAVLLSLKKDSMSDAVSQTLVFMMVSIGLTAVEMAGGFDFIYESFDNSTVNKIGY